MNRGVTAAGVSSRARQAAFSISCVLGAFSGAFAFAISRSARVADILAAIRLTLPPSLKPCMRQPSYLLFVDPARASAAKEPPTDGTHVVRGRQNGRRASRVLALERGSMPHSTRTLRASRRVTVSKPSPGSTVWSHPSHGEPSPRLNCRGASTGASKPVDAYFRASSQTGADCASVQPLQLPDSPDGGAASVHAARARMAGSPRECRTVHVACCITTTETARATNIRPLKGTALCPFAPVDFFDIALIRQPTAVQEYSRSLRIN
jgi:hypothetical protein